MDTRSRNKLIIIGLDGGTFSVLQPLIDQGKMPNLKKIQQMGVSGDLESTIPPVTTTAWSSFMTGMNPGKHGIFYFIGKDRLTGREVPVNSQMRSGNTLWRLLSHHGRKVIVLNCPTTYPPEEVNGVMVSCFTTPSGKRDFIYPKELVEEIETKFGSYPLYLKTTLFTPNLCEKNIRSFLDELKAELLYKFNIAHYLLDHVAADLLMIHVWGTDRIQHELWNLFDTSHPRYDRQLGEKFRDEILGYFSLVDAEIGRLRKRFGMENHIMILSDHGFGPVHKCIDLNCFLLQEGFISIKKNPFSQIKYWMWKKGLTYPYLFNALLRSLLKMGLRPPSRPPLEEIYDIRSGKWGLLLGSRDVDWKRTQAYSPFGIGTIRINLKGKELNGYVEPGLAYEKVRREIAARLGTLRDPDTGKSIILDIFLKEELYHGERMEEAPDIVCFAQGPYLAGAFFGFTYNKAVAESNVWPGNHRRNGIFFFAGEGVHQGVKMNGARIIDVAPTALYLLGENIPYSMDGKILNEAFVNQFLAAYPPKFYKGPDEHARIDMTLSSEEELSIKKRLQDLGYL